MLHIYLAPPYKIKPSAEYYLLTPDNYDNTNINSDVVLMTGFHNTPWVYREVYDKLRPDQLLIIVETYISKYISDLNYLIIDTSAIPWPYYNYNIKIYYHKTTPSSPDTAIMELMDKFAKPVMVIGYHNNMVRPEDAWLLSERPITIIDTVPAPKSILNRRLFLFNPGNNLVMYRLFSLDLYNQLPDEPIKFEATYGNNTNINGYIINRLINAFDKSWFRYPNPEFKSAYELIVYKKQWFNQYFNRFIGDDDIDTLINIWNTMFEEISNHNDILEIKQWLISNSLDVSIVNLVVDIGLVKITERVKIDGIKVKSVGIGVYIADNNVSYRLNRDIISRIDIINPTEINIIKSIDNEIIISSVI